MRHALVEQLHLTRASAGVGWNLGATELFRCLRGIAKRAAGSEPDYIEKHLAGLLTRFIGVIDTSDAVYRDLPLNTLDRPVIEFMAADKERRFLTGPDYFDFISRMLIRPVSPVSFYFENAPSELENWRRAGLCMMRSVYTLQHGDRESAYRAFDEYKALTPAAVHQ